MSDTFEDNLAEQMGWAGKLNADKQRDRQQAPEQESTLNYEGGSERVAGMIQQAKNRSRLAKYAGGQVAGALGAGSMMGGDLKDQLLSGDFSGLAASGMVHPVVINAIWKTVIPSWGVTLFVLMFIWIYDILHESKLPFLQKLAIPSAFLLYVGILSVFFVIICLEIYAITHPAEAAWKLINFFAEQAVTPS
jgi:hypothetical protein